MFGTFKNYIEIHLKETGGTKVTLLPLKILLNYTLADNLKFNNRKFKINSIKTNLKTGKSEIELLNE
ncbi:MAG: hypothetical protein CM15mV109_360 [uncultured marine virus]|nr:MAG: hypothetical protein CM15mV109_360 [uncultured marine virus]